MMLRSCFRSPSFRRALLAALVLALLPLAHATAQELPRVRITRDTTVHAMRNNNSDFWMLMRVDPGTVLEYIDVDGDQGRYVESNYYLVLLPRNEWGTSWAGWVSGKNLERVPPTPPAARTAMAVETAPAPRPVVTPVAERPVTPRTATPVAAASTPVAMTTAPRMLPEVVLRFAFDRSDLAETAKNSLDSALTSMRAETGPLSFSLGGHADATGPDDYNQKLGLARAETVRKYIVEQLKIPADRITVSSYGESRPVAPNTTRTGRAENRRVVVTVTVNTIAGMR